MTTSQSINSPLDCLGLPDEITRKIHEFHSHPICEDKYFEYSTRKRLFAKMSDHSSPYVLLDMYMCNMASLFRFSIGSSGYQGFNSRSMFARLNAGDGEQDWGNDPMVYHYLVPDDANDSSKFLPNSGTTGGHNFITKFLWLCKFVEDSRNYDSDRFLKNISFSWPKYKEYTPNMTMKKKELMTLLDNNGIHFYKSWSKSKLINAWYKSP